MQKVDGWYHEGQCFGNFQRFMNFSLKYFRNSKLEKPGTLLKEHLTMKKILNNSREKAGCLCAFLIKQLAISISKSSWEPSYVLWNNPLVRCKYFLLKLV